MVRYLRSTTKDVQKHWKIEDEDAKLQTEVALKQRLPTAVSNLPEQAQQEILKRYLSWLSPDDVDWIVQNDGDITGVSSEFKGVTLLHTVVNMGLTEITENLGERAKIHDDVESLRIALKAIKSHPIYIESVRPVLQVACQRKLPNLEILELLLDKCGADISTRGLTLALSGEWIEGPTALHCLAEAKYWW